MLALVVSGCAQSHTRDGARSSDAGQIDAGRIDTGRPDAAGADAALEDAGDSGAPLDGGCQEPPWELVVAARWTAPEDAYQAQPHVSATPLVLPPARVGAPVRLAFVSHGTLRGNVDAPAEVGRMQVEPGGVLRIVELDADGTPAVTRSWGRLPLLLELASTSTLAAADLDADGELELVAMGAQLGTYAFELDATLLWESRTPPLPPELAGSPRRPQYSVSGAPTVADLDGDGALEVVVGGCVLDGRTGSRRFCVDDGANYRGSHGYWGPITEVADLDADGQLEVLGGPSVYDASGTVRWTTSGYESGFGGIGEFIVGSPGPEVVLVRRGGIELLDRDSGSRLTFMRMRGAATVLPVQTCDPDTPPSNWPHFAGGPPLVADLDRDGSDEVVVSSGGFLSRFDPDCRGCEERWGVPVDDLSAASSAMAADLRGDGTLDIVHADQHRLRIIDGESGAVWLSVPHVARGRTEYPVVADLDGDGSAEILVGVSTEYCSMWPMIGPPVAAGVTIYRERHNRFAGAPARWTQHAPAGGRVAARSSDSRTLCR
ncbi:MAG: FG-GAP-like repeat-containing protein [Sandaracinaceae bacterium]